MDTHRLDDLARSITVASSRREALSAIFAASVTSFLAGLGIQNAAAKNKKRKKRKKKCKGGKKKCGKKCVNLAANGANCGACGHACLSGGCVHGACTCEDGPQCPDGCVCDARLEGGFACRGPGGTPGICSSDADCPLGSFCLAIPLICSVPCPE